MVKKGEQCRVVDCAVISKKRKCCVRSPELVFVSLLAGVAFWGGCTICILMLEGGWAWGERVNEGEERKEREATGRTYSATRRVGT